MSRIVTQLLLHKQTSQVDLWSTQYEVDQYVSKRRRTIFHEQIKTVLRKPAVLAGIFGAGAAKEILQSSNSKDGKSSSNVSATQLAMMAARLI